MRGMIYKEKDQRLLWLRRLYLRRKQSSVVRLTGVHVHNCIDLVRAVGHDLAIFSYALALSTSLSVRSRSSPLLWIRSMSSANCRLHIGLLPMEMDVLWSWSVSCMIFSRNKNLVLSYTCTHLCRRVCLKWKVYMPLGASVFGDLPLMEFMYHVFTRMPS